MTKEEKKAKKIITQNRSLTIDRRETSLEVLSEAGDAAIYNMYSEDKNVLFRPKVSITKDDIATIPGLAQLREAIASVES